MRGSSRRNEGLDRENLNMANRVEGMSSDVLGAIGMLNGIKFRRID